MGRVCSIHDHGLLSYGCVETMATAAWYISMLYCHSERSGSGSHAKRWLSGEMPSFFTAGLSAAHCRSYAPGWVNQPIQVIR